MFLKVHFFFLKTKKVVFYIIAELIPMLVQSPESVLITTLYSVCGWALICLFLYCLGYFYKRLQWASLFLHFYVLRQVFGNFWRLNFWSEVSEFQSYAVGSWGPAVKLMARRHAWIKDDLWWSAFLSLTGELGGSAERSQLSLHSRTGFPL